MREPIYSSPDYLLSVLGITLTVTLVMGSRSGSTLWTRCWKCVTLYSHDSATALLPSRGPCPQLVPVTISGPKCKLISRSQWSERGLQFVIWWFVFYYLINYRVSANKKKRLAFLGASPRGQTPFDRRGRYSRVETWETAFYIVQNRTLGLWPSSLNWNGNTIL